MGILIPARRQLKIKELDKAIRKVENRKKILRKNEILYKQRIKDKIYNKLVEAADKAVRNYLKP